MQHARRNGAVPSAELILNAGAGTSALVSHKDTYIPQHIPRVCGLSKSPHHPSVWRILHMQNRPLGSGLDVRSLRCRCIPVLNTLALSATSCTSFAWAQTAVACTRFEQRILLLFVCVLCRIPASQGRKSVKLGATRTPRRCLRANTLCLKGGANAMHVSSGRLPAMRLPLSPDPCSRFNIYRPG